MTKKTIQIISNPKKDQVPTTIQMITQEKKSKRVKKTK